MAKNASFAFEKLVDIRFLVDQLLDANCPLESFNNELHKIESACFRASVILNNHIHQLFSDKIKL